MNHLIRKRIIIVAFLLIILFISCREKPKTVFIPINRPVNVVMTNQIDEDGNKQGLWQEFDTINHRITKEYYFKNNLLDSTYLVYKYDSPDTLIFGHYKLGAKHGLWTYWDSTSNYVNYQVVYENDTLKSTDRN